MPITDYTRSNADIQWIQYSSDHPDAGMRCYFPTTTKGKWKCILRIPEGGYRTLPSELDSRRNALNLELVRYWEIMDAARANGYMVCNLMNLYGGDQGVQKQYHDPTVWPNNHTITAQAIQWLRDHAKDSRFTTELDTKGMVGFGNSAGAFSWLHTALTPGDWGAFPRLPLRAGSRRRDVARSSARPNAVVALNAPLSFVNPDPTVMNEIVNGMMWWPSEEERSTADPAGWAASNVDMRANASVTYMLDAQYEQNFGYPVYWQYEQSPSIPWVQSDWTIDGVVTGLDGVDDSYWGPLTEILSSKAGLNYRVRWGLYSDNTATPALPGTALADEVMTFLDGAL